jgi:hypothetical protein
MTSTGFNIAIMFRKYNHDNAGTGFKPGTIVSKSASNRYIIQVSKY